MQEQLNTKIGSYRDKGRNQKIQKEAKEKEKSHFNIQCGVNGQMVESAKLTEFVEVVTKYRRNKLEFRQVFHTVRM